MDRVAKRAERRAAKLKRKKELERACVDSALRRILRKGGVAEWRKKVIEALEAKGTIKYLETETAYVARRELRKQSYSASDESLMRMIQDEIERANVFDRSQSGISSVLAKRNDLHDFLYVGARSAAKEELEERTRTAAASAAAKSK